MIYSWEAINDLSLGRPIVFAERCKILQFIYNHIQNKDRVHSSTAVVGYEETGDAITIRTDKGRLCQGSILIGADGIHSHIRTVMAEKIRPANPALAQDLLEGRSASSDFCSKLNM